MTTFTKGTTVDSINLQPGELIYMDFSFYNLTSILQFNYMITVISAKTIIIWVFPNAYKLSLVLVICFILTTFNNEQRP